MADKENRAQTRRASKKRPDEEENAQNFGAAKKRTVLGELSHLSMNSCSYETRKRKGDPGAGQKSKKKMMIGSKFEEADFEEKMEVGVDEDTGSGDISQVDGVQECRYAPLMYQHLHSLEVETKRRPLSHFMEMVQKDLKPAMREVLVDWLVEVADEYKFTSDTLYLTVNYIDRYLSCHDLSKNKLQLLGVSCMLVAAKYEEISPPHVEDFCYVTDNTYTKEEIVIMEREVLKFLCFELGNPTTKTFIRIFCEVAQEASMFLTLQFDFLCCYLAELSLLEYRCVQFIPSIVAASVIFLARLIIQPNIHPWSLALQQYTHYKPADLKDCVIILHNLQLRRGTYHRPLTKKYMDHKFQRVALLSPPSEIPAHYFEARNGS